MTIYNKPDTQIFAKDAKQGEITSFPDLTRGWGVTIDTTNGIPPMEFFNALQNRTDEALGYLMQRGVAEWREDLEYPKFAITILNGQVFFAKQQNIDKNPLNYSDVWVNPFAEKANVSDVYTKDETYNKNEQILKLDYLQDISQANASSVVYIKSYSENVKKGDGYFTFNKDILKSYHNGGSIVSSTVPFSENALDYIKGKGETDRNGKGCWVKVSDALTPYDFGWKGDKFGARIIAELLYKKVDFKIPALISSVEEAWANWNVGEKFPICCYGDSTTDGRVTTVDGKNLATKWNISRLVGNKVPDGLSYDHNDSEVPNAYPNVLERILKEYHSNNLLRVYNAGYRGKQIQDGWAVDNVYNAVYGNPVYSDAKMIAIMFGLNDSEVESGVELKEKTYIETKALIIDAYYRNVQPVLMTCPPTMMSAENDDDYGLNKEVCNVIDQVKFKLAKEFNIEIIDLNKEIKRWIYSNDEAIKFRTVTTDGLHLNDLGHIKKAEVIFKTFARNNILTLKESTRIGAYNSLFKFPYSQEFISKGDPDRGYNKLAENITLSSELIKRVGNKNIADIWVYNENPTMSVVYKTFSLTATDFSKIQTSDLPILTVEANLFSAKNYYVNNIFSSALPEGFGQNKTFVSDTTFKIGTLKYGLNRIKIQLPENLTNLSKFVNTVPYVPVGYFEFVEIDQSNKRQILKIGENELNSIKYLPWRNVLRDSGSICKLMNSSGYYPEVIKKSNDLNNVYSLNKSGDIVEFNFNYNLQAGSGIVINYNLNQVNSKNINSTTITNYSILYNSAKGEVSLASIYGKTPSLVRLNLKAEQISNKNIVLRLTREKASLSVEVFYKDSLLSKVSVTDKFMMSCLITGIAGGLWSTNGTLDEPLSILNVREFN